MKADVLIREFADRVVKPNELATVRDADFSAPVREGHGCWQGADAFIRERSKSGLVFELTLGDDPLEIV